MLEQHACPVCLVHEWLSNVAHLAGSQKAEINQHNRNAHRRELPSPRESVRQLVVGISTQIDGAVGFAQFVRGFYDCSADAPVIRCASLASIVERLSGLVKFVRMCLCFDEN